MKTFHPILVMTFVALTTNAQTTKLINAFEKDTFKTEKGNVVITFIGHGTLMIEAGNQLK